MAKKEVKLHPIGTVVTAEEVLPGLLVHRSPVKQLGWTLTHEASGFFVLHTGPTKKLLVELANEKLSMYDWTTEADQLRAHPSLQVQVLECQLAISAERVRRERASGEKQRVKSQSKKGLTEAQWGDWQKDMNLRTAKTEAEKQRRKRWAKNKRR